MRFRVVAIPSLSSLALAAAEAPPISCFVRIATPRQHHHCKNINFQTGKGERGPISIAKADHAGLFNSKARSVNDDPLDTEKFRYDEKQGDNLLQSSISRRSVVQTLIASSLCRKTPNANAAVVGSINPADDNNTAHNDNPIPDLRCLLDLPPPKSSSSDNDRIVRIYLCRHGQTEFNRLGKMQGARIDAPLNDTGRRMALRLGKALAYLEKKDRPVVGAHSSLIRSKETAYIAAAAMASYGGGGLTTGSANPLGNITDDNNVDDEAIIRSVEKILSTDSTRNNSKDIIPINYTSSLNEVDFGPNNEGQPVQQAKTDMAKAYSAWAIGKIDTTPTGGGETGRQVLNRVAASLNRLPLLSPTPTDGVGGGGAVLAVSHGVYLRVLLAIAMDVSLIQASLMLKQKNCCVNVLDVSLDEKVVIGSKSAIFGGGLSVAPSDFEITIPRVDVVRVNEIRHLKDLLV